MREQPPAGVDHVGTARAQPGGGGQAGTEPPEPGGGGGQAAPGAPQPDTAALAGAVLDLLRARGDTVAVAESLTGGLLCAALTDIAGASVVVRGGIVAYATELKVTLLGVSRGLIGRHGAVHPDVAVAMAEGARLGLGASFAVATTGVAGPDPQDGRPVGTVHIAVTTEGDTVVRTLLLPGDRAAVRAGTVAASLGLLLGRLREVREVREETG